MANRATAPIEASASPRKPRVAARSRSSIVTILLVAKRATASGRSSCSIPAPSSATRMRRTPPSTSSTATETAPASRLFSSNSFKAAAGRSTTSPAAIWLTKSSGRFRIRRTLNVTLAALHPRHAPERQERPLQTAAPREIPELPEADTPLHAEQLRLLFRFSLVGYLATLVVIFTLGAILWQDLSRPQLFAWFVAIALVTVGRYLIYKAYIQAPPPPEQTQLWEGRFLAGTILAGVCWFALGTVLLPDSTRVVQRLSV